MARSDVKATNILYIIPVVYVLSELGDNDINLCIAATRMYDNKYHNCNKSTQRAQTCANAKIWNKTDPDFRINPDPDVCCICSKMLWMHCFVGVSHFGKNSTNRP